MNHIPLIGYINSLGENIDAFKFWRLVENRDSSKLKLKLAKGFKGYPSTRWGI
jgi:hypothetical protein